MTTYPWYRMMFEITAPDGEIHIEMAHSKQQALNNWSRRHGRSPEGVAIRRITNKDKKEEVGR